VRVRWGVEEARRRDHSAPIAATTHNDTLNRLQRPAGILGRGVHRRASCEEGPAVVGELEAELVLDARELRIGQVWFDLAAAELRLPVRGVGPEPDRAGAAFGAGR
jgi:hypothetical protein